MSGVAIITGSGRGIGAATAKLAARRGYAVCVNYLKNEARADAVVAEIRAGGGRAIMVQADTAIEDEVIKLFERVDLELGPVTALVNNAGITGRAGRLDSFDAAAMRRVRRAAFFRGLYYQVLPRRARPISGHQQQRQVPRRDHAITPWARAGRS